MTYLWVTLAMHQLLNFLWGAIYAISAGCQLGDVLGFNVLPGCLCDDQSN